MNLKSRRLILLFLKRSALIVAVLMVMVAGSALAGGVAYVNLQAVLEQHPGLAAAQEEFQAAAAEMEAELAEVPEEEQQQLAGQYQQMLGQLEQSLQNEMVEDILKAVEAVGEDAGYDTILDQGVILFGGTDISEVVMAYLVDNYDDL